MIEKWPNEGDLPLDAIIFVRVHNQKLDKKNNYLPNAAAFKNTPERGPDLSSDWDKYTTAEQSREQIGLEYKTGKTEFKNPQDFLIASFLVQDLLDLELNQRIEHSPRQDNYPQQLDGSPWNRAHTSVIGDAEERRLKMIQIAKWEIEPSEYKITDDKRIFRH